MINDIFKKDGLFQQKTLKTAKEGLTDGYFGFTKDTLCGKEYDESHTAGILKRLGEEREKAVQKVLGIANDGIIGSDTMGINK